MGGGDKFLLPLAGRPLIVHVIGRLSGQLSGLAINANGGGEALAAFGLPVLPDPIEGWRGPLAGVLAAMDWAAGRGERAVVTVSADTPFLPADMVARLAAAADGEVPAIAASGGRRHPVCGLWPVARRAALAAWLEAGGFSVNAWAAEEGARVVAFEGTPDPFFNINTPADFAEAEGLVTRL